MRSLLYFILLLLIYSCSKSTSPSRVLTPTRKDTPKTTVDKNKEKVDTIAWTILSEEDYPPITDNNRGEINVFNKEVEVVSLLIPFQNSGSQTSMKRGEKKFASFYGGFLLGLEDLEVRDKKYEFNVFDTRRDKNVVNNLIHSGKLSTSDVVIGPYETENLAKVAEWGKSLGVPVISPWRASSSVTSQNPYFFQLRPSIEQYYASLLQEALSGHKPEDIYIIQREGDNGVKDASKSRVLHGIHEANSRLPEVTPINDFIINMDSLNNSDILIFDSLFVNKQSAAIILPNYSSSDSRYVYSVIRKLNAEISDQEISIYGMPSLINENRLDLEFFRSMNLNTVDFKHLDKSNPLYNSFVTRYYDRYGALPNDDSFNGYDMAFLLDNLAEHASQRISSETYKTTEYLSFSADFSPYNKQKYNKKTMLADLLPLDFMANKGLMLIKFDEGKFVARPLSN